MREDVHGHLPIKALEVVQAQPLASQMDIPLRMESNPRDWSSNTSMLAVAGLRLAQYILAAQVLQ